MQPRYADQHPHRSTAPLIAALISLFLLSIFVYWFGIADRSVLFLYGHTAHGIPLTRPFDAMTSSRYWMAGLVASGFVFVGYVGSNLIAGRSGRRPPDWRYVWAWCVLPLLLGIPAITMTLNAPTLPLDLALACAGVTLIGLALALWPARIAAEQPQAFFWLMLDGVGLLPIFVVVRVLELPARGVSMPPTLAWVLALGSLLAAWFWWLGIGWLRARVLAVRCPPSTALQLYVAGCCLCFLLLPFAHYARGSDGYHYITAASNVFAFDPWLQALVFAVGALLTKGVVWVRG